MWSEHCSVLHAHWGTVACVYSAVCTPFHSGLAAWLAQILVLLVSRGVVEPAQVWWSSCGASLSRSICWHVCHQGTDFLSTLKKGGLVTWSPLAAGSQTDCTAGVEFAPLEALLGWASGTISWPFIFNLLLLSQLITLIVCFELPLLWLSVMLHWCGKNWIFFTELLIETVHFCPSGAGIQARYCATVQRDCFSLLFMDVNGFCFGLILLTLLHTYFLWFVFPLLLIPLLICCFCFFSVYLLLSFTVSNLSVFLSLWAGAVVSKSSYPVPGAGFCSTNLLCSATGVLV